MTRRRTVAVVDHGGQRCRLPDPVAPTTSTRPRLVMTISLRISGKAKVAKSGISAGWF